MVKLDGSMRNNSNDKKTILHIVECLAGGVLTYIVDLANQLCEEYNVNIAYATRTQTPNDYQKYFDKRIKLIKVNNLTRSINPLKDTKAFFEIRKIAKEIKPNIIHLHSSKAGALGRWAFNGREISMFYTPHGYSFLMNNNIIKRTIYNIVESISGKRMCTTIACSKGEYDATVNLAKNSVYINNSINVDELNKLVERYNTTTTHPLTVFTLGRICHQKNPELFNAIAEKTPDVKFLWIGGGDLQNKLVSPNIEITGWVNREKALEYSMQADIFILPSLWEGLSISLLEAMYMKKLCLVSDVIGNRDVIKNGINGFVCKNLDEYVNTIKNEKSNLYQSIIENAYQDILEKYNTIVMSSKYKKIYSKELAI